MHEGLTKHQVITVRVFIFHLHRCINADLITNAVQHIQSSCNGFSLTFELMLPIYSAFCCQIDSLVQFDKKCGTRQCMKLVNVWGIASTASMLCGLHGRASVLYSLGLGFNTHQGFGYVYIVAKIFWSNITKFINSLFNWPFP